MKVTDKLNIKVAEGSSLNGSREDLAVLSVQNRFGGTYGGIAVDILCRETHRDEDLGVWLSRQLREDREADMENYVDVLGMSYREAVQEMRIHKTNLKNIDDVLTWHELVSLVMEQERSERAGKVGKANNLSDPSMA